MKFTPLALAVPLFGFVSCTALDPNYAEFKRQQQQQQAQQGTNPYGVPGANPYGNSQSAANPYDASTTPYQPVPPVNPPVMESPSYRPTPPAPAAGGSTHTVAAGDSLWGLSRKYNTTVEAIQAANGLSGTMIRTGQTLRIP